MSKKDIALMINGLIIGIVVAHTDFTFCVKMISIIILGISIVTYGNLKDK